MRNLSKNLDYRDLLKNLAVGRKRADKGYSYGDLASAIQIGSSYLSRVFKGEAHLSMDQVILAGREFGLSEKEMEYISLLFEYGRTGLEFRKQELLRKIRLFQDEERNSKHHLTAEVVDANQAAALQEYFLDPFAILTHLFLTVPAYQKHPEQIAQCLVLSSERMQEILNLLIRLDVIRWMPMEGRYQVIKDHLLLEKKSKLNQAYQALFRAKSAEHLQRLSPENKFQFSVTVSMDEDTRRAISDEFNRFVSSVESLVRKAPAKGVYQLNFDLFRWDQKPIETEKIAHTRPQAQTLQGLRGVI